MINYFYLFLFLVIIFSCEKHTSRNSTFFQIKRMEYDRISDPDKWNDIKDNNDFNSVKYTYVNSVGKMRDNRLLPILKEILTSSTDDSLTAECIFAIGQIGSVQSERILLDLPFQSYSKRNKLKVLSALSHCASANTINFYDQYYVDPELKPGILIDAAICSRKNIDVSKIKFAAVDSIALIKPTLALSYFLYSTGNMGDLSKIIQIAQNSEGVTLKYALKKLKNLFLDNNNQFYTNLIMDSLSLKAYKSILTRALKRSASWEAQYYAIPLASILKDSILTDRIYSLKESKNIYVTLAALEYLPVADPELALTALLEIFGKESNLYIRGKIIKILSEYYPEKAYSFVMQNLDKGDSMFKSQLLDALAKIKSKMAIQTLQQFINVDDPILVYNAFENLKKLGYINNKIINTLLNSESYFCVATALDFLTEKNQDFESKKLQALYKKFNKPSEFEVQFSIINLLKTKSSLLNSIAIDTLIQFASHYVVRKKIFHDFPELVPDIKGNYSMNFQHPAYLVPDSVEYFSNNPIIEIATDRGHIRIELFSTIAPYSVNNILKLVSENYYNGLIFHRVIPDFVIQGGDPSGTGWGGPDYLIPSEDNKLPFIMGSVGIATSGFDTGSSQFFICQSEQPHLNGNYTLIGQVIEGMDIVNSIIPGDKIFTIKVID